MHPNKTHIHREALRCLRVAFGFALNTIGTTAYRPEGSPKTAKGTLTESLSTSGIIMQQPLRLPPQFDS